MGGRNNNINIIEEDKKWKEKGEAVGDDRKLIFYKVNRNNKDIIINMFLFLA